ncbi:MAG: DUF4293 domain-containing protein [Saprospiraceae bacterium]
MIQRIQTLFLLLAAGALGGQFVFPYLKAAADDPARTLPILSDGVFNPLDNPGILGLTGLGAVISIAAVFLFKNRPLQARLALTAMGTSVMLTVLLAISVKTTLDQVPLGGGTQMAAGLALPLLAMALNWLAAKSVRKDEALVRSMDRLR